jgi:hypothetical protein
MRKLIITLVLTAFIVTLSSPILNAAQWDYATGPNWPEQRYVERVDFSGEEDPWDVENIGPTPGYQRFNSTIYLLKLWVFIISIDNIDNSEQDNNETEDLQSNNSN